MEINASRLLGKTELKEFTKFVNGRMSFYSYRIEYDMDGNETGRTQPEKLSSIGWDDGTIFTETDFKKLKNG